VLSELGIGAIEAAGFTCCPETQLVRTVDEHAFYLTAARNLSLAAEHRAPLLTPCSGCYLTFKQAASHLKKNWREARRIEKELAHSGRKLELSVPVWHFAEWLCEEIGPAVLRRRIAKPLWGIKLAVHYGCHLLRPSPAVHWDNPIAPTKIEDLLRAFGVQVVDYESKMLCCGSALERVGQRERAHKLLEVKLAELRRLGVDALVVACPACFLQFDLNQTRGRSESDYIPVLYLAELLALALGYEPEEIGVDLHRTPLAGFLARWCKKLEAHNELAKHFDLSVLETCAACRACDKDCPLTVAEPGFYPSQIVEKLLLGEVEAVLLGPDPWRCLDCMTCVEKCHSRFGLAWMFEKLRHLAVLKEKTPPSLRMGYQSLLCNGTLGVPRSQVRERLGLPPMSESRATDAAAEIRKLPSLRVDGVGE